MPAITIDLVIAGVIAMVIIYGVFLGHNKLRTFALSVFVGIVMVLTFAESLFTVLQKANWTFGGKVTLPAVKIALFSIPVVALEFGRKDGKRGGNSFALTLLLSVLTAALLISSVFSFLDDGSITNITDKSQLANWIYSFRLVWLAAVPITVIIDSLMGGKKSHH